MGEHLFALAEHVTLVVRDLGEGEFAVLGGEDTDVLVGLFFSKAAANHFRMHCLEQAKTYLGVKV